MNQEKFEAEKDEITIYTSGNDAMMQAKATLLLATIINEALEEAKNA